MVKYTRENYRKNLFSFKNGWADDKRNKKFKKSTWKLAIRYVNKLMRELDIGEPVILPCGPNCIDLDWNHGIYDWHLLISICPDPVEVGYYGGGKNFRLEVMGNSPPEPFEVVVSKIKNWYKKIEYYKKIEL